MSNCRHISDISHVLGSGFLDPILALNSSAERDLDNLPSETNSKAFTQAKAVGETFSEKVGVVTVLMNQLISVGRVTHLALVQLFLELFHCFNSHHVILQVV